MAYQTNNQQQDFCFTVQLAFPSGFDNQQLTADAKRWLTATVPTKGYSISRGINTAYTGWRHPTANQRYLFNNQDRLTFVHNDLQDCVILWGTRRSTASLHAENVLGLGSNFRLELEKALLFYATRIYHGSFIVSQIDFQTPVQQSLPDHFHQRESITPAQLNQPFDHRDHQLQLAAGIPNARDLFSITDRFQQPLLVALKNFIGATSSDNRHRFDSSWRCLNTIYSTIFQRPMTAENRGDNDARTLQYMAEKVFSQSLHFAGANQLATRFVLNLPPRRVIKLVADAARTEARFVDGHPQRFAFPEAEKFNYTWMQLNFIVPFFQMVNEDHDVDDDLLPLFMHFGPIIFHQKRNGEVITYPRAASLKEEHVKTIQQFASSGDSDGETTMYKRYCQSINGLLTAVNAYHRHLDQSTLPTPDLAMTLRIFFNYVRVLRNNYFHGGYSAEDFLFTDTSNQQEIAAIADILTEYNRVLLNQYASQLSQSQRDRSADSLSW
ncbi:hypothetical protein [uncultured Limosilactobacillus sp.]|uniref:hypothetical protein n=1 Tax=uncultured Limosilactobacillus sp. TaxID=2837629 RepID=UPI0025EA38F4|nr:hypothetical protein [uncultured Limosilactobacillus sp.]